MRENFAYIVNGANFVHWEAAQEFAKLRAEMTATCMVITDMRGRVLAKECPRPPRTAVHSPVIASAGALAALAQAEAAGGDE